MSILEVCYQGRTHPRTSINIRYVHRPAELHSAVLTETIPRYGAHELSQNTLKQCCRNQTAVGSSPKYNAIL